MNKYQKNIMERASRKLTNRADGANETIILQNADPNVDAGVDKFFGVTVTNNEATPVAMALVPANFDTERLVINNGEIVKTYDNVDALRTAGFNVDAVLADGTVTATVDGKTVSMTCASNDTMRTIKQFLDYIKLNPQRMKHLDIVTSNTNMWAGNMTITFCNPFFKQKESRVQLNTFFSRFQYQSDRLGIDFSDGNQLEFSDLLLWIVNIPASATVQFIMTF